MGFYWFSKSEKDEKKKQCKHLRGGGGDWYMRKMIIFVLPGGAGGGGWIEKIARAMMLLASLERIVAANGSARLPRGGNLIMIYRLRRLHRHRTSSSSIFLRSSVRLRAKCATLSIFNATKPFTFFTINFPVYLSLFFSFLIHVRAAFFWDWITSEEKEVFLSIDMKKIFLFNFIFITAVCIIIKFSMLYFFFFLIILLHLLDHNQQ